MWAIFARGQSPSHLLPPSPSRSYWRELQLVQVGIGTFVLGHHGDWDNPKAIFHGVVNGFVV